MIIVKLTDGLGNQMFQYAAGRRLAYYHNTDLFLDITDYANDPLRKFELDNLQIKAAIAPPDLIKQVPFSRTDVLRLGIRKLYEMDKEFCFMKENDLDFHEEILSLPDNSYLDGYWQNEKYFLDIAEIISSEFSFVKPPSVINQKLIRDFQKCNSVSLHIRRGDYVSNQRNRKIHGILPVEYYRKTLNLIEEKVIDPHIFVFSDDLPWARDNIKTNLPLHFISHNKLEKNFEDLRLMSNCKHHIIANSSFSWWGAWLSGNKNKLVIAPLKWFSDEKMNNRQTIVPDNWIKI